MDPEYIASTELFGGLSLASRQRIAPLLSRHRLKAGDHVFDQGDAGGPLYVLDQGRAEVVVNIDGRNLVLAVLEAGTFFGELGFFQGQSRSSAIRAASPITLTAFPPEVLHELEESDPAELMAVYRRCLLVTAGRLREANRIIVQYFRARLKREEEERHEQMYRYLLVHDLRSPLAICETGLSQVIQKQGKYGPLTAKQERVLKRSRRSALFLRRLVNEILEVGRTESQEVQLDTSTIRDVLVTAIPECLAGIRGPNLDAIEDLTDYQELTRVLASQDFFIEVDPGVLDTPLRVDPWRLIHVIMNLVGNALKHAPGWLTIRIERDEDRALFSVVDRGPGIPEAFREQIFDFSWQSRARDQGVHRGFGIGLAGAAHLVKGLNGSIWVEPGDGGVGTKIVFDLPWRAL